MSLANIHFDHYLLVRKNLLICSKSLTEKDLDDILAIRLKYENYRPTRINIPTLSLSQTESNMLQMWMAGHGTSHISAQMNIKAKTVSSHKGNIKKKDSYPQQTGDLSLSYDWLKTSPPEFTSTCVERRWRPLPASVT
ncbi:Colanic acid capsular biosynthesis activation accesory protein RcsA [Klebsiella michiganensis]|uniref:Colanic acid capsular biosynthesis activation accesory protein RcsA n=1 Tax=Klebsiella michiganensis TaxID=1134687 RepID=A0A7H4MW11_9ENTR|nr:Colanic acid capsular biosynthesis activation accesory protein RcsA [Klebsiella michiganensis]